MRRTEFELGFHELNELELELRYIQIEPNPTMHQSKLFCELQSIQSTKPFYRFLKIKMPETLISILATINIIEDKMKKQTLTCVGRRQEPVIPVSGTGNRVFGLCQALP